MKKKILEEKYTKLKKKHKVTKAMLLTSMRVLREQNLEIRKKTLLEKGKPTEPKEESINLVIGDQKVNIPQGSTATITPNAHLAQIVIEDEYLWLSEILANSNNLKTGAIAKFFIGQLGIRDIKAKELISAKPETDGKDGKWVILYVPFEELATV